MTEPAGVVWTTDPWRRTCSEETYLRVFILLCILRNGQVDDLDHLLLSSVSSPRLLIESTEKIHAPIRRPGEGHAPIVSKLAIGYTHNTDTDEEGIQEQGPV